MKIKEFLKKYLLPKWPAYLILLIIMILSVCCGIILPQIVGQAIDNLSIKQSVGEKVLIGLPILYIMVVFLKIGVTTLNESLSLKIGWTVSNNIRKDLFRHCLTLELDYFKSHTSGEITERIDGDVSQLNSFFSSFFVNLLGNMLLIIGVVVMFYKKSWILGIITTIFIITIFLAFQLSQNKIQMLWKETRESTAKLDGAFEEMVQLQKDLYGTGGKEFCTNIINKCLQKNKKDIVKAQFIGNWPATFFFSALNLLEAITFSICIYQFYRNEISIGDVYVLTSYISMLNIPLSLIRYEFSNLQKAGGSLSRILEFWNENSHISSGEKKLLKKPSIVLEDVYFSYGQKEVLKDVNLFIRAGETVALLGRTGSGKSTLFNVLSKLYETDRGNILLNGINIKDYSLETYHQSVVVIPQDVFLFPGTLRENLLVFTDKHCSDEQLIQRIGLSGLKDWYTSLADGLDTLINSNMLSAGQAQMLAFVRATFQDAKLILLDEVTSRINFESEKMFSRFVKMFIQGKTCIFIIHDIRHLYYVDKVVLMKSGKIIKVTDPNNINFEEIKEFTDEEIII